MMEIEESKQAGERGCNENHLRECTPQFEFRESFCGAEATFGVARKIG